LNPTTGTINVYFNFPVDTTVAIPGNSAKGNVNFQDKLVERINHANYSIDLALYSFSGMQEVADALVLAKNRGVKIRVVYDHRYPDYPIQNSMQALINNGIQISQRPPETQAFPGIMHNKFIIFDARDTVASNDWLWTGSWNVTSTELNWKNNVIEINDPSITSAYTTEFEEMWGSNTDTPNSSNAKFGYQKTDNTLHNFNIGGIDIQSYFSPSDGTTNKIISQINEADYSLYLALYVITRDDIRNTIVTRTNNGMSDLRGIVEDIDAPGSEFFTLQSYGEFFQSPSPTLHHKYGIIDASYTESEPTTVTGSHNWSSAAENDNDENTLIIKDVYITNQYMQEFKKRYNEAGGTGTFIIPVVEIEDEENTISDFSYRLYQNYPNPFNPVTTIRFEIPYSQYVELTLYDVLGRKVRTLFEGEVPAGIVAIDFSSQSGSAPVGKGGSLASGVYIYRIKTKDFTASKKLILLK
jgi:phosphatidylserine/phosphatidylglycerophosphate/cardiolipin synthase-like enzyme